MLNKKRDHQGRFLKSEFKSLQIEQDKPVKQFPIVECVAALTFILGALVVLDHSGVIDIIKYLKP